MKILVVGAGVLGSLYAARLQQSGQEVTILARKNRASQIRENGIVLIQQANGGKTRTQVEVIEHLSEDDYYDLAIVLVRKNQLKEILDILKPNTSIPNFLFMVNNPDGPAELIEALGKERVILGFAGAGGKRDEDGVVTYHIMPGWMQSTILGEIDGLVSPRVVKIATIFRQAGFSTIISKNMDAWLKTHLALVSPVANAIYLADGDPVRLANTRDGLVLMVRAIREGFHALNHLEVPVIPMRYLSILWLPEGFLIFVLQNALKHPIAELVLAQHARAARDEMQYLAVEFQQLILQAQVPSPNIDKLLAYTNPQIDPMPEGSRKMPLNKRDWLVWILAALSLLSIFTWLRRKK